MRALLVYESMFGNTQAVARAIAEGLAVHMPVEIVEVSDAPERVGAEVDLLVVGGPTHAFSMSRASTREDATTKSDQVLVSQDRGIREWIDALREAPAGTRVATFDTKVEKPHVPGSAARAARKHLRKVGFRASEPPTTFFVDGMTGPLVDGELDRARSWGDGLGATMEAVALS